MNLAMLLEMAAEGLGDRVGFGPQRGGLTYQRMLKRSQSAAGWLAGQGAERVVLVDVNSEAVPLLVFASAMCHIPFVPLNYRLADDALADLMVRTAPAVAVVADSVASRIGTVKGMKFIGQGDLLAQADAGIPKPDVSAEPDDVAVLLFTSGTTGHPKAAMLRHRHLVSYIIGTVEFMGAEDDECALISVPPYHIAGISAVLSSVYSGRRMVHLDAFKAESWVQSAREEAVTHAMVVPTMLGRILDVLEAKGERLPALRHLSYGGGRMPVPVVERALTALPHVDFVNAYGLTETSSTIAVLGPDDHRRAMASVEPDARRQLASVGRPLPTIELEIRDASGAVLGPNEAGEVFVRGEQVAGEYLGRPHVLVDGWFPTNDAGYLDAAGYLYVEGRLDDVIVRGGENISPGEIEAVLIDHPAVAEVGVVGVPDTEWGEQVVAAVVLGGGAHAAEAELQDWVRARLRSSRTPQRVTFVDRLPYTETGKLLRRVLRTDLGPHSA